MRRLVHQAAGFRLPASASGFRLPASGCFGDRLIAPLAGTIS
jgi:hypothetical protein